MEELTLNVSLLSPVSDLIAGASTLIDLIFGRAGNDVFYPFDPLRDSDAGVNIDILFGDTFDNTPEEFELTLALASGDPFAILNFDIPSIGSDRFVLGDEFQPYYTSFNPFSLVTDNFLGFNDFAVIYDFDPEQDTIQLNGKKENYFLLKIDSLPVSAIAPDAPENATPFSGYALFSLQAGIPDIVSLIVQKPEVELKLDDDSFLFVGNKPEDKPEDKKIGQFGTTGLDYGYNTTTDVFGNLYVVGSTSGSLNGHNRGSSDVWVTKYSANGTKLWERQYGSANGETAYEIITDAAGNFYMAGSTSGNFVDAFNSPRGTDAWVAKYDRHGNQLWGRQFGSDGSFGANGLPDPGEFGFSTSGFGLQLDASGDVYVSGLTINDNRKFIPGTNQPFLDFPVEDDSWIVKLNGTDGTNAWTDIPNGVTKITPPAKDVDPNFPFLAAVSPFFDESYDLATDAAGNSYLVGWTQGLTTISDPSRDLLKYDAWISKVDTNGNVVWTEQFGSVDEGLEFAWGVDTDSQGNIYVSGWTTGDLGEATEDFKKAAERDVFLAKFTSKIDDSTGAEFGDLEWAKKIGSPGDDGQYFGDLFIDDQDNIFLTGYTDDKLGDGNEDATINGWVGRFDTNGNNLWLQQLGIKDKADYATGVTARNGQVFVTGFTEGFLGTSYSDGAQGAAIDGWLAQLDLEDGKLQKFEGTGLEVVSSDDPGSITTIDISDTLVTDDKLPKGSNNTPSLGVYYGDVLDGISPAFDPNSENSMQAALMDAIMNDPSVFSGDMPDLKLEGSDDVDDLMMGFMGNDEIKGKKGNDQLHGLAGDDKLEGEDGDDTLYGGAGADELKGGDDNDTFVIQTANEAEFDVYDGGNEELGRNSRGDTILNASDGDIVFHKFDDAWDIETVDGGGHAIVGNASNNQFDFKETQLVNVSYVDGGAGEDEIKGGAGDETFRGGADKDKLEGKEGNDSLFGDAGTDELKGGKGDDFLHGGADADKLNGEEGNDILIGGTGNDELDGNKGDDILIGVEAATAGFGEYDKLKGGEDSDTFVLGDSMQAYYLGRGNADFALIDDFKRDQGDIIQLYGGISYNLKTDVSGLEKGTAIFQATSNDLIGIVKDVKGLDLADDNVFSFV